MPYIIPMKSTKNIRLLTRIILCFCLLILGTAVLATAGSSSANAALTYALIIKEEAYLYRTVDASDNIENRYFLLPRTYFVQVLQTDAAYGIYKVRYKDIEGYVKSDSVEIKDYTPKSIYPPDVMLKISIEGSSVYLRSRPDHTGVNVLDSIPSNAAALTYYNVAKGSVALSGSGNEVWYYINYRVGEDSNLRGYIYSAYIIIETTFSASNDTTALIPSPEELPKPPVTSDPGNEDLLLMVMLIISSCIPVLVIVYLMYKKQKPRPDRQTNAAAPPSG